MNRFIVEDSIEFSPNKKIAVELPSNSYISHIDCSLMARIKSFYNSVPTRRMWGKGKDEVESIPKARRTAFPLLIKSLEIANSERRNIAMRYRDGYEWFCLSLFRMGRLKRGTLPMWGHIRKIQTNFIIHPGMNLPHRRDFRWDRIRVIPTSDYPEFVLQWADSKALGRHYEIEWARLDLISYGYQGEKEKEG